MTTPESPVSSELPFKKENRVIHRQIRRLIPFQKERARYTSPVVERHWVSLSYYKDGEDGFDDAELPEKFAGQFSLPLVIFSVESPYPFAPVTTPYGDLSQHTVDQKGIFHFFYNTYVFDVTGKAKKTELIIPHIDGWEGRAVTETLANMFIVKQTEVEAIRNGMKRINFEPRGEDERLVDLENGDYEIIHALLTQIKKGEWQVDSLED